MVYLAAVAASSAAISRSILSISESVLSKFASLVVAASAIAASASVALVAVALSTAGAFDAKADGGVSSMASVTVIILCFSAQQTSSLPRAPSSSVKTSSDVALVDLA
jgi:hypothetical protein